MAIDLARAAVPVLDPGKKINPYKDGVDWLLQAGVGKPTEDRVLLKAVLVVDGSALATGLEDTLNAVCHEVVAVGPDVKNVKVGEHVLHVSAAADAADHLNPHARFVYVREKWIVHHWDPQDAMEAYKKFFL